MCVKTNRPRGLGRILLVGLMLLLWLGTATLAVSPQLHQKLHKDSKSASHECVVTLLSKSHLLAGGGGSVLLVLIPVFFGLLLVAESFHFSVIDFRLSPSRAPPLTSASLPVVG